MAKARSQKRRERRRHNPMRVPDTHLPRGVAVATQTSTSSESVPPIIQKLESAGEKDRVWACAAVSNVIQSDPSTRGLLQSKNVIGILIKLLSDSSSEVVFEAAGALRNLCVDGGYDICSEMFNKNILTPLQRCIPQIADAMDHFMDPQGSLSPARRRLIAEFTENILTIFTCLSEASQEAFAVINDARLVPFLMSFIQFCQTLPLATVTAAAHCLYVLSDENVLVIECLRASSEYVNFIIRTVRFGSQKVSEHSQEKENARMDVDIPGQIKYQAAWDAQCVLTLRLFACGILKNISPLPAVMPISAMDLDETLLLPELLPLLDSSLTEISSSVNSLMLAGAVPSQTPKADCLTDQEIMLRTIERRLTNIQLALEILATVAANFPVFPADLDIPDEPGIDENSQQEMNFSSKDIENKGRSKTITSHSKLVTVLSGPLLKMAYPTEISFPPVGKLASHPPITRAMALVHIRALDCLNNLFLSLGFNAESILLSPLDAEAAISVWQDLWNVLYNTGYRSESGQEQRFEMWVSGMGALWGVARTCKSRLVLKESQIQMIIEFWEKAPDDDVKVKCIGTLESLAQVPNAIEQNQLITDFLFSIANNLSRDHPEPCIQAVSALIDIYSDETMQYDINFRQFNRLMNLRNLITPFKNLVRSIDRRGTDRRELRNHGEEVLVNLRGFVQYRENLLRSDSIEIQ